MIKGKRKTKERLQSTETPNQNLKKNKKINDS